MCNKTIIIGVSGASASGKTLLAHNIINEMGNDKVVLISEDSYYKDQSHISYEQRVSVNYDHPSALDHDLLCQHLQLLQQGQSIEVPIYDHTQYTRTNKTRNIGKQKIIILEGILLFTAPALRSKIDIKIYMDTQLDICLMRRLQRDIQQRNRTFDSVITQYQATVRPMYLRFIEPSKVHADIIVPRGGENRIAIDMIKAKMYELLGTN